MRLTLEDPPDEPAQHRAGAHLDEGVDPGLGHRPDGVDEAHRPGDLRPEARPLSGGVVLVGRRDLAGVDRQGRRRELDLAEEGGEGLGARGDDRRVKGRRHRQAGRPELARGEGRLGRRDRPLRPREDHLGRRVVVGENDPGGLPERLRDRLGRGRDGDHRPVRAGGGHQLAAAVGDAEEITLAQHTRGVQRCDLAEAVPGHRARLDPEGADQPEHRRAGAADRRLGPLGLPEPLAVGLAILVGEARDREDQLAEAHAPRERMIGLPVPGALDDVERHRQVRAHPDVLAPLPREEERDLAGASADAVAGAVGELERRRGIRLDPLRRPQQASPQLLGRARDHRQAARRPMIIGALGRVGGELEGARPPLRTLRPQPRLGDDILPAQDHELAAPAPQTLSPRRLADVLLQGDVEVGAAEAERADARPPRVVGAADPGARLGVDVERRVLEPERGVGPVDLDRRRQDPVMEGHHRLKEARSARSGLGVADLRLHRSERAPLPLVPILDAEDQREAAELRGVARLGPGPVPLDQLDRLGAVARPLVGPREGVRLAGGDRGVDALAPAVRRGADASDHGVDPIAVALGVLQAAQGDHAQPLAEHRPVRLVREGPAIPRHRQRRRLAEAHEHEDLVEGVDPAGDHQVRVPHVELLRRHRQRREGRGAGRIGHAVGAAEVEAVGDPTGDDVAQEPGEAALLPLDVVIGDPIAGLLDLALPEPLLAQRLDPDRPLEAADHRRQQLLGRGHPEDDRNLRAVHRRELLARRVAEHPLGDDEAEELRGVGRLDDRRRHPPGHRVEVDRVDKAAAAGVGLVARLGVGIVVVLQEPVALGDLRQKIAPAEDVAPKAGRGRRAREERGDADNCEGGPCGADRVVHGRETPEERVLYARGRGR